MTSQNSLPHSSGTPNVNPDDVATYLELKITKQGTLKQIAAAKRVDDAMQLDPVVREYVEQLLRLEDPAIHPEKYPSAN